MQNTVQSTNVLFMEDAIAYIATYSSNFLDDALSTLTAASWTNLGALGELSLESKIDTIQPASMNVEHDQVISRMAETINLTIQELSMVNYNKLMGNIAQSVTVAGTSTSASTSYTAGFWTTSADKFVVFGNQSWSSTSNSIPIVPTSIIISGSSTFVAGSAYRITQNEDLEWGFLLLSTGAISSTDTLVVSYDFVPKSQSILYHGGADETAPFMIKLYSIYSDGRTITTYYPWVHYISGGARSIKSGNSGELQDMKFTLEARECPDYTYSGQKIYKVEVQTTA